MNQMLTHQCVWAPAGGLGIESNDSLVLTNILHNQIELNNLKNISHIGKYVKRTLALEYF